jgi:hypothetical protein
MGEFTIEVNVCVVLDYQKNKNLRCRDGHRQDIKRKWYAIVVDLDQDGPPSY